MILTIIQRSHPDGKVAYLANSGADDWFVGDFYASFILGMLVVGKPNTTMADDDVMLDIIADTYNVPRGELRVRNVGLELL